MKIEILDAAEKDLLDGYDFYERQSKGLGDYFLDSLFSDIESLYLYAGIHGRHFGYHRLLSKRFPSPFIIISKKISSKFTPFWIVAEIQPGLGIGFRNLRTSGRT